MVVIGVILLILSLILAGAKILFWIGIGLIVLGLIFNFAGPVGPSGSRRRYY